MRHRPGGSRRLAALAVLSAVLLAGCGNPGNVDGKLVNDWQPIGAPTGFTPQADTCHLANFTQAGTRAAYEEVDCKIKHRTETVYVGSYADPAAEADKPPAEGSAGAQAAYRTCDQKATEFVGGPWRTARLWVGVTHPSTAAWAGGARWFRCELLEISSIEDDGGLVMRIGTLRNALKNAASDLLLTCYAIQMDSNGAIGSMPAASCGARHNAEFAGVWYADELSYPEKDDEWATFHDGCRKLIAGYVDVPDDADLQYRTGVVSLPGGKDVWALGDHGVRCYLWLADGQLTGSMKGKGTKGLPIQFK